jgi:hypothetical protein
MATSHFSSKTKSQTKTSSFFFILSSWHSNACCIYQQVVLLRWFSKVMSQSSHLPWGFVKVILWGGGGALLALTHFRALCSTTNHFTSCIFPSIANNTHIISPPSIVSSSVYEHSQTELCVICFSIQPQKCVAWSPSNLPPKFNTPSKFTTPSKGI